MTSELRSYLETALWSSTDEDGNPLDDDYSTEDIHPDTLAEMAADLASFIEMCEEEDSDLLGGDYDRAAHDFWLTRNRHGAGFWDGDWEQGGRLTEIAHTFGSYDLYIGDDGMIHG